MKNPYLPDAKFWWCLTFFTLESPHIQHFVSVCVYKRLSLESAEQLSPSFMLEAIWDLGTICFSEFHLFISSERFDLIVILTVKC